MPTHDSCTARHRPEPDASGSNYCDMAENERPGYGGSTCTEIDIFEANNVALQTAVHTQSGGEFGSGDCDRNGCFARIGGPQSPADLQDAYGAGGRIDSSRPFTVKAALSEGLLQEQGGE